MDGSFDGGAAGKGPRARGDEREIWSIHTGGPFPVAGGEGERGQAAATGELVARAVVMLLRWMTFMPPGYDRTGRPAPEFPPPRSVRVPRMSRRPVPGVWLKSRRASARPESPGACPA